MILEYCLVPKTVIDKILDSNINIIKESKNIVSKSPVDHESFLSVLKKSFKSKSQYNKAYEVYNWLKINVKDLSLLNSGEILSPIRDLNILDFIRDVTTKNKNINTNLLNIYKVFIAITNIPLIYIDNMNIRRIVAPNTHFDINKISKSQNINKSPSIKKRKLDYTSPSNISKKIKKHSLSNLESVDNTDGNINASNSHSGETSNELSPESTGNIRDNEKFIADAYKMYTPTNIKHHPISKRVTRSQNINSNINLKKGSGLKYTTIKPKINQKYIKWISY